MVHNKHQVWEATDVFAGLQGPITNQDSIVLTCHKLANPTTYTWFIKITVDAVVLMAANSLH